MDKNPGGWGVKKFRGEGQGLSSKTQKIYFVSKKFGRGYPLSPPGLMYGTLERII